MTSNEIDEVLIPVSRELSDRADEILDLREAALKRDDPGRCISCYFKLLAAARPGARPATTPLRLWLEQHLEVVARDSGQRELERLPVHLGTDDIEGYCRQLMQDFHYDRDYQSLSAIELAFQFKEAPARIAVA